MSNVEVGRHGLDIRAKAIIIFALLASFVVVMIPIWQMGEVSAIKYQTARSQAIIDDYERENRALKASISEVERDNFKSDLYQIMASI